MAHPYVDTLFNNASLWLRLKVVNYLEYIYLKENNLIPWFKYKK